MRNAAAAWLLVIVPAVGCGNRSTSDPTRSSASSIQGGSLDSTDSFVVGIAQLSRLQKHQVVLCSGALLAPNLVATARHCVVQLASAQIQCSTSTFGDAVPTADLLVTADATITPGSDFARVTEIIEPSGSDHKKVCGNDIALLVLGGFITQPAYVVPTIAPSMADHSTYSTRVATIGYGIDSPTDDAGISAGARRIKENIGLACVPNDAVFDDCLSQGENAQLFTESEFLSGDASTCEGDSGSNAFDQASFDAGKLRSFGVLSRGGVSQDGQTCVDPVYERFDAWGQFLIDGAKHAASMGGYSPPVWVNEQPLTTTTASAGGCSAGASGVSTRRPVHLLEVLMLAVALLAISLRRQVHR